MINVNYLNYLINKPFHSYRHKLLKRESTALAKRLNLSEKIMREISDYTHDDFSTIENKRKDLMQQIAAVDYDALNDEELIDFYRQTQYHFYALPIWNAECGRAYYLSWSILPYLKHNRYKDILDFGAGTGDVCIYLAELGFRMYYTDVSKKLADFSQWRFKRRDLGIEIIETGRLSDKKFDCVLSFDVFEHLKNLPRKIKEIHSFIKKAGSLVFNIELSGDGLHLEENKIYSDERKLDAVLREAGFSFSWKFKRTYFYKKR